MGRETRNFRQTRKGNNSNLAAKNFARVNRQGSWGNKIGNLLKLNNKGGK